MIETQVLDEDDPVELLDGWIVPKMPRNPPHDGTIQLVEDALRRRLPPDWRIRVQSAITTDDSEPEPDLAVVPGPPHRFLSSHPRPADVAVVIEVADSSLAHDRGIKARAYARAGIVEYWVVNLPDLQVEVHTGPSGPDANPSYRGRRDYTLNDSIPLTLSGRVVAQLPVRETLA